MSTYVDPVDLVDDDTRVCLFSGHQHHGAGGFCGDHLAETRTLIAGVARMTRELGYHLMPGAGPAGEKVTTSRTGSPTPARLDVLSLIGPGVTEIRTDPRSLAVQVRRWSTVTTYDVTVWRDGKQVTERRELRDYHAEILSDGAGRPVTRLISDQVGAVPPAEWLDAWVRRFRIALQHPPRPLPAGARLIGRPPVLDAEGNPPAGWVDYGEAEQAKRLALAAMREWVRICRGAPTKLGAVAEFLGIRQTVKYLRDEVGATVLGLRAYGPEHVARVETALAGARPPVVAHDTATAEWILRYGAARTAAAVEVDAGYLTRWLPMVVAINDDGDPLELADFAAELRHLHRELECVLGLTRDDQWVGRCPARLVDVHTGDETGKICGAGIWHDAHRDGAPIRCPRCHSSWKPKEWLSLAARIRHDWPIDVRRRYTAGDRKFAESVVERLPRCRGCEATMAVRWVREYRRGDRVALYRPAGYECPNACLSGGTSTEAAA